MWEEKDFLYQLKGKAGPEQVAYDRSIRARDAAGIADALFDGTVHKGRSNSRQRHRPVGSAVECDGLEGLRCTRRIGNASRLAPGLCGRAGDKLRGQASSVAVWHEFESKRHLDMVKKLLPLRLGKTKYQSS